MEDLVFHAVLHNESRYESCRGARAPRAKFASAIAMQHAICEPSHLYILGNHRTSKRKAKIAWARGGCLGAGSRRRARQAAIVWGEAHTALDPQVPEWGNPAGVMPRHPPLNAIGGEEATRGTETSKYPEEEKSTEIPRVAASESGRCPNRRDRHSLGALARRCCGGRCPGAPDPGRGHKPERSRTAWEGRRHRVRAP